MKRDLRIWSSPCDDAEPDWSDADAAVAALLGGGE
jgi:hypothetical protein